MFNLPYNKKLKRRKKRMDLFFLILAILIILVILQHNSESFFPGLTKETPEIFKQLDHIQENVTPLAPLAPPEAQENCTVHKKTDSEGRYIACITRCNGTDILQDARSEARCTDNPANTP